MVGLVWACCRCPWSARVSGTPSCFGNTFLFRGHLHHGAFVGLTCTTSCILASGRFFSAEQRGRFGSGQVEPDSLAQPGVDRGGVDASRSDLVAIEHRDGGERPVAAGTVAAGYAAPGVHASPAVNRGLNPHRSDSAPLRPAGSRPLAEWPSRVSMPEDGPPEPPGDRFTGLPVAAGEALVACGEGTPRRRHTAVRPSWSRRRGRSGRRSARCWPPAVSARPRAGRPRPRAGPGTVAPASAWTEMPGVPSAFITMIVQSPLDDHPPGQRLGSGSG